jgi:hypothetical protein
MIPARTGIPLVAVSALLALSWIGTASAADLEIKKFRPATVAVNEPPRSFIAARRVPMSRQFVRLALRDDMRMGLILGVGY